MTCAELVCAAARGHEHPEALYGRRIISPSYHLLSITMVSSSKKNASDIAQIDRGSRNDLHQVSVVYVDSRIALAAAQAAGLNDSAQVRTTAPALLADPTLETVQADAALTPARLRALEDACIALGRACKSAFSDDPDVALIASRLAVLQMQPIVAKAAFVTEEDFQDTVAVVELCSHDSHLNEMIRSPLTQILKDNKNLIVMKVPIDAAQGEGDPRPPSPTLKKRLAFSTIEALVFRAAEWLSRATSMRGPRGSILMLRENELSKETAFWLFLMGYAPRLLSLLKNERPPKLPKNEEKRLKSCAAKLAALHLGPHLADSAAHVLEEVFGNDLVRHVARYRASLPEWKIELDLLARFKPKAVLSNHLNEPELIGLYRVLRERRIPLVGFQHGVTIEINDRVRQYEAHLESAASDLEILFNERAVELSQAGIFRRGRAIDVGLPKDYYRMGNLDVGHDAPEIWYISTAFYVANHGQIEGVNDYDKFRYEFGIVEKVLARLRKKVLYKPYPGRRFEDPDPVETAAASASNIEIYRGRLDLRYIVGSARLLITSRGYSTPSWCLTTGKPMIHIDIPDATPLPADAREAFAAGVFLFDAGAADFHDSLRRFLDRPIEEIESMWAEKSVARDALVRRFFSSGTKGAGRRAAREIRTEILAHS